MMQSSSINRFLLRSVVATTKTEQYVRHASSGISAMFGGRGGRTISMAVSPWSSNHVPSVTEYCAKSPSEHQLQGVRLLSSSSLVENTTTLKESYEFILVDATTYPGVGVITLHRPKALNALCDGLFADLIHAATVIDQKYDDIGCIVLTGSTKAFAAGADISEMKDRTFDYAYTKNMFHEWANITKVSKPIIAAVNGFCLGGGCELAMMCDMIIASDTAKFGQPEINLGVIPGAGGTQRLTRAIGKAKAMHMCLTGEIMNAEWAERAGLVAKIVPSDELLNETIQMATKIASKGRMSVMMAKEAVNASQELSLQEGLRLERRLFHSLFATADQKEGMSAFLEKRTPNFTNK